MQKITNVSSLFKRIKYKSIFLKMKLITVLILTGTLAVSATSYSQVTKINLSFRDSTSLKDILGSIEKTSEFIFVYDPHIVNMNAEKIISADAEKIDDVLDKLFQGTNVAWMVDDRQVFLYKKDDLKTLEVLRLPSSVGIQQQAGREVTGNITDSKGQPVIGASVVVKGTTTGTNSDIYGKFKITVPVNTKILLISFIGMKPQEVDIAGKTTIEVQMEDETTELEEVVVVGYGTQKKVTVTGAVSSVSEKQLVQTPVANISNALAGRATGVLSVQRSGAPGEDQADIRIRGLGSYAGTQSPLIMVDGIETDNYNTIDPNEIESISILKDASSTAVYGVRGANGVLIITTKRGSVGKQQISYSGNFAATTFTDYRERQNAYDYTTGYELASQYDSYITGAYTPLFTQEDFDLYKNHTDPVFHPDVDWMEMMYKDFSFQQQHNLNIKGGAEHMKYFVSLGYFDQEGLFKNTDLQEGFFDMNSVFERYNFRSNLDFNITKRLTAKVNISSQIQNKRGYNNDNVDPLIRQISLCNPIDTPGLIDGRFVTIQAGKTGRTSEPFATLYGGHRKTYNNYLDGSLRFDYDFSLITKGLSAHGMVSYQNYNNFYIVYNKPREVFTALKDANNQTVYVSNDADGAFSSSSSSGKRRRSYIEMGLNYNRTFGSHSITGLLLYNQSKDFDPGLQYLIPRGYQGIVGRVAYDYKKRYMVEFDAGYNGTENFAPGKRFGFFPAYSFGWVPSEESFFPKNNIVTYLKLRGSFGEVGNDKIGGNRFLYLPGAYTYQSGTYYWGELGSTTAAYGGALEGIIGNPNLTWERALKKDIGIDITLFKGKIKMVVDLFWENRDNILSLPQNVAVSSGLGNNIPPVNLGKVKNQGWDGEIAYNNKSGNFNYWIKANYTFARNTIIFMDEIPNPYPYLERTGQRIGQYYGYVDMGLYNSWDEVNEAYRPFNSYQGNKVQPGDPNIKDVNGDGIMDQFDRGPIGYSNFPEETFGMSFGFDVKGFDFSILFQGASNVTFIGTGRHIAGWLTWAGNAAYLENSWSMERLQQNLPIYFPRYNVAAGPSQLDYLSTTLFYKDASYIRIRNLEIGYRLENIRFMKELGLNSARVYFNGSNLLTWAPAMQNMYPGVDPEDRISAEIGNTEPYPRVAVFNFGININF